jgi:hypothetical protein
MKIYGYNLRYIQNIILIAPEEQKLKYKESLFYKIMSNSKKRGEKHRSACPV